MWQMLNIDVRAVWAMGRGVFATWFTSTALIGMFFFVRKTTQLTRTKCVTAAIATTAMSWLLVAAVPLPLLASGLMEEILHGHGEPVSWVFALIASAIIGTASGCAVLAVFRQRITGSGVAILFALNLFCVGLTFYRIVAQLIAHPPQA
jgi:uncharacterized membrane protein